MVFYKIITYTIYYNLKVIKILLGIKNKEYFDKSL